MQAAFSGYFSSRALWFVTMHAAAQVTSMCLRLQTPVDHSTVHVTDEGDMVTVMVRLRCNCDAFGVGCGQASPCQLQRSVAWYVHLSEGTIPLQRCTKKFFSPSAGFRHVEIDCSATDVRLRSSPDTDMPKQDVASHSASSRRLPSSPGWFVTVRVIYKSVQL